LHIFTGGLRVHLLLDRDAFAADKTIAYDESLAHLRFTLENHATSAHSIGLAFTGLAPGSYRLIVAGKPQPAQSPVDGELKVQVPISGSQVAVELVRGAK
jgi:hypothetical protein